ncbi:hypothetical protein PC116_g28838 [Phytophthora cactorum]|nr:hypothetical protein PC116_g28838 [Phytophthora cactorum]
MELVVCPLLLQICLSDVEECHDTPYADGSKQASEFKREDRFAKPKFKNRSRSADGRVMDKSRYDNSDEGDVTV